jgi:DNA-binding transcriptional MerR regulator
LGENGFTLKQADQILEFENSMNREHQLRFRLEREHKELEEKMKQMSNE